MPALICESAFAIRPIRQQNVASLTVLETSIDGPPNRVFIFTEHATTIRSACRRRLYCATALTANTFGHRSNFVELFTGSSPWSNAEFWQFSRKLLKMQNHLRVIKRTNRSRDASLFCAV